MKDLLLKFNRHKTILIGVFIGLVAFPTISLGGTFVSALLQGKSVEESIQILGDQLDLLIGRVGVIEENQEELKAQLTKQQEQITNNKYCEELSKVGSKYFSTRQPLKDMFEAMVRQNSITFEEASRENRESDVKVLSEENFIIVWQEGKIAQDERIAKIKPYYDEYMSKCNK